MMKSWPFGAAVVFLAAVLISACSSYRLGNMSGVEGKWVSPSPGRQRGPSGTKRERLYLSRQKREKPCLQSKDGCCTSCPAGTFLENCTCETCDDGTYLDLPNSCSSCHPCAECMFSGQQVVVKECAPEHDRVCGCQRGYYRKNIHQGDDTDFHCNECTNCTAKNMHTEKNCSEKSDAECGACLLSFQRQGEDCQKIPENGHGPRNPVYLLLLVPCLLLLWASIAYYRRRRTPGKSSPVGIHNLVNSACGDTLLDAAGTAPSPKHQSVEPMGIPSPASPSQAQCGLLRAEPSPQRSFLQGRKLYTVIDAVPVRRWKEFMRGLGLRDGEIEAVEVEHTQLREQQYEMLKCWRQQQGATVDAIFAVLEDMQLGGCAQELREQLQPRTLPPSI